MNANYEAVVSLVELLVKKAGFDVHKDYSEVELEKTKNSLSELAREKGHSKDKKTINSLIENLKVRQANWENNAEIVGKSLLKAYEEGKDYNSVKARIDLLGNLALKGTQDITVTSVYEDLKKLNKEYKELNDKISNTSYANLDEKEMDLKYKSYLENKLTSLENEVTSLDNELAGLREVEIKEVGIESKIKEYISKLKIDLDKIDKVVNSSINSDVTTDVWQKLEIARTETKEKLDKSNDLLSKTQSMLEEVKKSKDNISERKSKFEIERTRANTKLNNINTKIEENKYDNNTLKMIDVNNSEIMRLEIESLNNKKDVIYVDAIKVKEELIKEWNKGSGNVFVDKKEDKKEVLIEDSEEKEPVIEVKEKVIPSSRKDILDEFQEEINKASRDLEKLDLSSNLDKKEEQPQSSTLESTEQEIIKENEEVLDKIDSLLTDDDDDDINKEENNKMELDW